MYPHEILLHAHPSNFVIGCSDRLRLFGGWRGAGALRLYAARVHPGRRDEPTAARHLGLRHDVRQRLLHPHWHKLRRLEGHRGGVTASAAVRQQRGLAQRQAPEGGVLRVAGRRDEAPRVVEELEHELILVVLVLVDAAPVADLHTAGDVRGARLLVATDDADGLPHGVADRVAARQVQHHVARDGLSVHALPRPLVTVAAIRLRLAVRGERGAVVEGKAARVVGQHVRGGEELEALPHHYQRAQRDGGPHEGAVPDARRRGGLRLGRRRGGVREGLTRACAGTQPATQENGVQYLAPGQKQRQLHRRELVVVNGHRLGGHQVEGHHAEEAGRARGWGAQHEIPVQQLPDRGEDRAELEEAGQQVEAEDRQQVGAERRLHRRGQRRPDRRHARLAPAAQPHSRNVGAHEPRVGPA
mmetsp:Transcript_33397/g.83726  ORF Transcript_33397/g.83726 Transcript_33397/m.83726 type:complete len:415 (-) Transcript_33397:162-1406(-)